MSVGGAAVLGAMSASASYIAAPAALRVALPEANLAFDARALFDEGLAEVRRLSSALWTALSGAERRVGFDRGDAAKFLDELVPVPSVQAHETVNLAALVRHASPDELRVAARPRGLRRLAVDRER